MAISTPHIQPLVSICIPVYNSEKTIKKTLDSIIAQTYTKIEIIVIDNNSTDESVEIVRKITDPRIRLIQNAVHLPCAEYNWNRCFQYATGEYMSIFHADDIYSPEIISNQISAFKVYEKLGCVFTLGNIINDDDDITEIMTIPHGVSEKLYSYTELLSLVLTHGNFMQTPTAMMPTRIYKRNAPFRYEHFKSASDFDMWLRTAQDHPILILNKILFNYRVGKNQGSFAIHHLRVTESDFFKVLDYHIKNLKNDNGIPQSSIDKYELFQLNDVLIRANNLLILRNIQGLKALVQTIRWKHHIKIIIKSPSYSGWIIGTYIRLLILLYKITINSLKIHKDRYPPK